jgi:hypothetical protein
MGGKNHADLGNFEDIYPYGVCFDVFIQPLTDIDGDPIPYSENNWVFLKRIFIREKSENAKQFRIEIENLKYGRYYVKLKPFSTAPDSTSDTLKLDCSGEDAVYSTSANINGNIVRLKGEFSGQPTTKMMRDSINFDELKRIVSSESGAPLRITTISEVVNPDTISKPSNYTGVAVVGVRVKASDRVSTAPEMSFFVSEGRKIRNLLHYGVQQATTTQSTIIDTTIDYSTINEIVNGTTKVRNLDTKLEGTVTNISNNRPVTTIPFSPKDRFIIYNYEASNYFPDIYVDWLINPEGGLGAVIDGDNDIDYDSIVKARRFVKENEFYWDGVLSEVENFSAKVTKDASLSLLYPFSPNGLFGLTTEDEDRLPIAVFNASNILKDSFEESVLPWQESQINQVVVVFTDGTDNQKPLNAVVARTDALVAKQVKLNSITIEAPSISNPEQAKKVAGVTLNSKRYQDKIVKFKTATQGLFLAPGEAILVQHTATEYDYDISGYVTEIGVYDITTQTQRILLSRQPSNLITSDYKATIQLQENNTVLENLTFTLVLENGFYYLDIENLPSPISLYDPVVIGRAVIEDKVYRIQNLAISENGEISISAVLWSNKLFDFSDLDFKFQ